ncbi:MAG: hypothetical protein LBQ48_06945, partial [Oscillospiraceae bacterium]|nr:hypothetical protein [Oscillospiraceae bacterium]
MNEAIIIKTHNSVGNKSKGENSRSKPQLSILNYFKSVLIFKPLGGAYGQAFFNKNRVRVV